MAEGLIRTPWGLLTREEYERRLEDELRAVRDPDLAFAHSSVPLGPETCKCHAFCVCQEE